jgi:hypothetical protein
LSVNTSLKRLDLGGNDITGDFVKKIISHLTSLEELVLDDIEFGSYDIEFILEEVRVNKVV